jgi:LTXXQ motif family protein
MQHWAADREALLDAKLGGLRAGLRLNPDQEKLWGPFEAAVREAAELRMDHMKERMEMMRGMKGQDMGDDDGGPGTPVDRLETIAKRLSEAGAAIKKIADSAQPLYASLDDSQKRIFGMLSREMMMMGRDEGMMESHGAAAWGARRHDGEGHDEEQ